MGALLASVKLAVPVLTRGADRRGEYMGAYQMVFSLAFAASALAGTAVLEHFGAVVLWTGVFVAGCVSAGLMMGIDGKELKI